MYFIERGPLSSPVVFILLFVAFGWLLVFGGGVCWVLFWLIGWQCLGFLVCVSLFCVEVWQGVAEFGGFWLLGVVVWVECVGVLVFGWWNSWKALECVAVDQRREDKATGRRERGKGWQCVEC